MINSCHIFFASAFIFWGAQSHVLAESAMPAYLTLGDSPGDFELFANGGWDGNWYVGYNSMWIARLETPQDKKNWSRAYIGAKLGRMKSESVDRKKPWVHEPHSCELYMGVSSTPAWKSNDVYFLTSCEDLPLEGSPTDAVHSVGESRWYWREVPLEAINFSGSNFVSIWSNTPALLSASSSPILAAAEIAGQFPAWLNRGVQGSPPLDASESLESQLSFFAPALAIKLVPEHEAIPVKVELVGFQEKSKAYLWQVQIEARNFERAQAEISLDGTRWVSFGRPIFSPPFSLMVSPERIQAEARRLLPGHKTQREAYLRIAAIDEWGNKGYTQQFSVYITD